MALWTGLRHCGRGGSFAGQSANSPVDHSWSCFVMCRKTISTLHSGVFRQNLDRTRPRQVRCKCYVAGSSRLFLALFQPGLYQLQSRPSSSVFWSKSERTKVSCSVFDRDKCQASVAGIPTTMTASATTRVASYCVLCDRASKQASTHTIQCVHPQPFSLFATTPHDSPAKLALSLRIRADGGYAGIKKKQ